MLIAWLVEVGTLLRLILGLLIAVPTALIASRAFFLFPNLVKILHSFFHAVVDVVYYHVDKPLFQVFLLHLHEFLLVNRNLENMQKYFIDIMAVSVFLVETRRVVCEFNIYVELD